MPLDSTYMTMSNSAPPLHHSLAIVLRYGERLDHRSTMLDHTAATYYVATLTNLNRIVFSYTIFFFEKV